MEQKRIVGLLAAFTSFAFALRFDRQIILFFQIHRNPILDIIFTALTHLGTMIAVLFIIISLFMLKKHKRAWIIPLWLSLGFAGVLSYIIKYAVMRGRPEAIGIAAVIAATGYSFPSAHSATAFSTLPVMDKVFKKLNYVWIAVAVLIAFSRLYLGVHYLSDVIFGGMLGFCSGWLFLELKSRKWFKKINILDR
ncbi:MAG: phosphatase PAP2 family protein [Candidatus Nanoarchaeia archaeon]|nr:phosphatase PAP2 family protein [Candidatus Nanoarchaeia archaeon]